MTIRSFYVETANAAGGGACAIPSGRNIKSATVQYGNGSAWITATTFSGKTDDVQIDLPAAITTTQLRLYDMTTAAGNGNSIIFEWHVYSAASCFPPP